MLALGPRVSLCRFKWGTLCMFFHSRSIFEKFHMTCFWCRVSERLTNVVTFCIIIWVSTGWVGWANNVFCCTFSCTCARTHTHMSCYAAAHSLALARAHAYTRASCYAAVTSCYAAVRCLGLAHMKIKMMKKKMMMMLMLMLLLLLMMIMIMMNMLMKPKFRFCPFQLTL